MKDAGVPRGTWEQYGSVIKRLTKAFPGRQFAGITGSDLAEFLYGDIGVVVGKSTNTASGVRSALKSFFNYGISRDWRKRGITVPGPVFRERGRPGKPKTRLTQDQLLLLLEQAEDPVVRMMIALAMQTALRISDIRKIQVRHIDLQSGVIHVWIKKTGRYDAIPVTADLEGELRRYLVRVKLQDPELFLFPGKKRIGFGVWDYDWTRMPQYNWAAGQFKEVLDSSGIVIERGEAWHVIRRSVARLLFDRLREEMSHDHALRVVMVWLGHMQAATTERYLGLDAEVLARDRLLRGQVFLARDPKVTPLPSGGARRHGDG
ncbi:tyrosine-type recombinase/integrase [Streptomyces sp. NPDC002754]